MKPLRHPHPRRRYYSGLFIGVLIGLAACQGQRPPTGSRFDLKPTAQTQTLLKEAGDPLTAYLFYLYDASMGRLDPADRALERARDLDADSVALLLEHANFLAMRSDLKRARALAEKALLLSPDQPDAITLLGKIYASQGYTLKAIELYEKAVAAAKAKGEPVSDIYPLLIQDYLSQGDIQKAFKATQALLHYSNQSPDGYFFLGLIYDEYFNNPEKALQAYNQVLLYNPRDTLVLGRMAQIYIAQRQYDAALSVLKRIEDIDPHNAGTLLKIALIDYEQGKKAEAKALFEQIARENPDSDRIHYYLGILHFEDNHYALARDELKRVPKTSDYYKDAITEIIVTHVREEDWRQAKKRTQEALAIFPQDLQFYEFMITILERTEKSAAADRLFADSASTFSENPRYHTVHALYYERQGRRTEALEAMQTALSLEPENTLALNYIGYTYAEQGIHLEEAIALLRKAKALDPNNGYILDSLGWAYFKSGKLPEAKRYLERALQLAPDEATILNHLGDLHAAEGNTKQALSFYQRGLDQLAHQPKEALSREEQDTLTQLKRKLEGSRP